MTFAEIMRGNFGYECITTFWEDFSIADKFGESAIKDTYNRAFNNWKGDYKYLTELVLVLNHKCWFFHNQGREELSRLYGNLFYRAKNYACGHLKGKEYQYFFDITD